jgi:hypothetical protein
MAMRGSDRLSEVIRSLTPDDQRSLFELLRVRFPIHPLETEFGAPAEVILEAIARSSDLSKRGVLGLIGEAALKVHVLDNLAGWEQVPPPSDAAFDYCIRRGEQQVRIQVKRQRQERHQPKRWRDDPSLFVVETQRTRSGKGKEGELTRPYRFTEFDLLAVCMQPSTDDWACFRFACASDLLSREDDPRCMAVLQPVSLSPTNVWHRSIEEAIAKLLGMRSRTGPS